MNRLRRVGLGLLGVVLPLGTAAAAAVQAVQYREYDQRGNREYDQRGFRGGYDDRGPRGNEDRGRGGNGGNVPGGSFLRSCGDARMVGSTLVAVCGSGRGQRFETSIDVGRCGRSEIGNSGGVLQCGNIRGSARRVE